MTGARAPCNGCDGGCRRGCSTQQRVAAVENGGGENKDRVDQRQGERQRPRRGTVADGGAAVRTTEAGDAGSIMSGSSRSLVSASLLLRLKQSLSGGPYGTHCQLQLRLACLRSPAVAGHASAPQCQEPAGRPRATIVCSAPLKRSESLMCRNVAEDLALSGLRPGLSR